jgi:hypothetical protein
MPRSSLPTLKRDQADIGVEFQRLGAGAGGRGEHFEGASEMASARKGDAVVDCATAGFLAGFAQLGFLKDGQRILERLMHAVLVLAPPTEPGFEAQGRGEQEAVGWAVRLGARILVQQWVQ